MSTREHLRFKCTKSQMPDSSLCHLSTDGASFLYRSDSIRITMVAQTNTAARIGLKRPKRCDVQKAGGSMINQAMIREIASHRGDPVLTSLYVNVDGHEYPRSELVRPKIERLFQVARQTAQAGGVAVERAIEADLESIGDHLFGHIDRSRAKSVAAFACSSSGYLSILTLPVPLPDRVSIGKRPHVAPLLMALDAARPFVIAIASHEGSRIVHIEDGEVEVIEGPWDTIERRIDTETEISGFSRYKEEAVRRHLRRVADAISADLRAWPAEYVLLGGPSAAELAHYIHEGDRAKLSGRVDVTMATPIVEVVEEGRCAFDALESSRKELLAAQMFERGGITATVGISNTLAALSTRSVGTLLLDRDLDAHGLRCTVCGQLGVDIDACPRCGGALEEVPDLLNAAIDEGLAEAAMIEFVDSPQFISAGGMGALERY